MRTSRRTFIRFAAWSGAAVGLGLAPSREPLGADAPAIAVPSRPSKLRILILGGTGELGPYQVRYALDRGHSVTMFNRGITNPKGFPGVEQLIGDRASNLTALEGRHWDVVIDNSKTDPSWVERSARLLAPRVKQYMFVSSRRVYSDISRVPMTVDAPVSTEMSTVQSLLRWALPERGLPYALNKALSEQAAQKYFPGRTTIVRPGSIVGPGTAHYFTYWPLRIQRGGEVLAPGNGTDPVQLIDVRDLSEWMIRLAEQGTFGVFNTMGPGKPLSFSGFLDEIRKVTTSKATFTWVDADFLAANGVQPANDMPLWQPLGKGMDGTMQFDIRREIALGLTFRPLAVTARDSLDYYRAQPAKRQAELSAGFFSAEREAKVLSAWHARGK